MRITYDSALRDYMARKNLPHIVVDACFAKTCGGAIAELDVQLADEARAAKLRPRARAVHAGEMGDVLVMARELEVDEQVVFRLKRFLGLAEVVAEGIRAYRF
ncbi:MAG TPA: hypothetical protein H9823_06795 [Candidatus Rubneribacter avistercoris]|nr:hypothetical protein [Candidatus Rubneribacter avistercoris]